MSRSTRSTLSICITYTVHFHIVYNEANHELTKQLNESFCIRLIFRIWWVFKSHICNILLIGYKQTSVSLHLNKGYVLEGKECGAKPDAHGWSVVPLFWVKLCPVARRGIFFMPWGCSWNLSSFYVCTVLCLLSIFFASGVGVLLSYSLYHCHVYIDCLTWFR